LTKKMKEFSIFLILAFLLFSCNYQPQDVKNVLDAAGGNRGELEKVINHYKKTGDKEKLKAAYFLIGNLDHKYAIGSEDLKRYDPIFIFFQTLSHKRLQVTNNSVYVKEKWDSLVSEFGAFRKEKEEIIPDFKVMTSDYMIKNIDLAFAIRDSVPWGHKISFDQFCEYILAFRFNHEPLEDWRSYFYGEYRRMRDTIRHDSIYQVASRMHKLITNIGSLGLFTAYPFDFWIEQMETGRMGTCVQIATYRAQLMRASGIPTAVDFTPAWGDQGATHHWNTILLENGKPYHYEGTAPELGQSLVSRVAKVYRETFGRQATNYQGYEKEIPLSVRNDHMIDVTPEYTKTLDIKVQLKYPAKVKKRYAIICSPNTRNWVPQDWGEIKDNEAHFKNMGVGNLYIAQYYEDGIFTAANDPFILDEKGEVVFISPDVNKDQDMRLIRKYPMSKWIQYYHDDMVNCMFQGANRRDFKDSVVLHTITRSPNHIESVNICNAKRFRFMRFKAPSVFKGNVAEIEFYGGNKSSDTLKLTGKIIGFPEVKPTFGTPYQNAFDGNIDTYFHGFYNNIWWAGLDLGEAKVITKIKYCPRSDTNFIVEGDRYELCYWNKDEWVSMGEQAAKIPSLEYKNVPSGGLYILHNLSRGKEERIFTYEGGKQVFW
jgi:hypothetical protein